MLQTGSFEHGEFIYDLHENKRCIMGNPLMSGMFQSVAITLLSACKTPTTASVMFPELVLADRNLCVWTTGGGDNAVMDFFHRPLSHTASPAQTLAHIHICHSGFRGFQSLVLLDLWRPDKALCERRKAFPAFIVQRWHRPESDLSKCQRFPTPSPHHPPPPSPASPKTLFCI